MRSFFAAIGLGTGLTMAYLGCGLQTEGDLVGQATTSSSSSSSGIVIPECMADMDCAVATDCTSYSCKSGKCEVQIKPDDTEVLTGSVKGDCQKNVCKGGKPTILPDDTDLVMDNDPCTVQTCSAGQLQQGPAPDGTLCGAGDKLACVSGLCEGCNNDISNCNMPTQCQIVACTDNKCVFTIDEGKVLNDPDQTDCKQEVCDMNGNAAIVGDVTEMPPQQGDNCKVEQCDAVGNVIQVNANQNSVCAAPPGICFNDSQCKSGTCTPQPKNNGTSAGDDGTLGNCKALACDGAGNTTVVNNNADKPNDTDMTDCVLTDCMNGMPTTPNKADGLGCTMEMGGKCCNGTCCANAVNNFCLAGACCASGKTCGTNCCANATDVCDGANNCCPSGKTCMGTCCPNSGDACAGNMCCPSGKACGTSCCPNAGDQCAGANTCCDTSTNKVCGTSCCPGDNNCAGNTCCGPTKKVCNNTCCGTGHDCNGTMCCPAAQQCNDGVTCCPNGQTCTGQNSCN